MCKIDFDLDTEKNVDFLIIFSVDLKTVYKNLGNFGK